MSLSPITQTKLYGLENKFTELSSLFINNKLPTKIILSGQKGIGKCTLAYHLINFVLSKDEVNSYDTNNFSINNENKSFKLVLNNSHPNFNLIDVLTDKKQIDLSQIKLLIKNLSKSTFTTGPRIILIDNIELLNRNSINALLKTLEEPNDNTFFILIHNNKKVLPTLTSRCLNFKISLTNKNSISIFESLIGTEINQKVNNDLIDYYFTPGNLFNLLLWAQKNKIDLKNIELREFLSIILDKDLIKKDLFLNYIIYNFIELYLIKKISIKYSKLYSYFIEQFDNTKKFNLNFDVILSEFKFKVLNG